MHNTDNQMQEELRMMYQLDTQAMEHFKQRQWDVVRYVLMISAAIIAFDKLVAPGVFIRILEFIIVVFVFFAGFSVLQGLEIAILKCRGRKVGAAKEFTCCFRKVLDNGDFIEEFTKKKEIPRWFVRYTTKKKKEGTRTRYKSKSLRKPFLVLSCLGPVAYVVYLLTKILDCP